jgi:glycine oxidase
LSSDIIVIGGGIAGLTVAHELLRLGATVTILERQRCAREASWAGGGILSPLLPWNYSCPVTRLTQLSNALFPEFIEALRDDTGIDPEYQPSGMLVLGGDAGEPDSEGHGRALREARELKAEAWCGRHDFRLSKVRSHDIVPLLAGNEAALWLPDICQVRNPRLLQALMKAVAQSGGIINEHAEITGLHIEHGRVQSVSTSRGEKYTAPNYVVAAGAWSRQLLQEHALKLNIWPVRGQILLFQAQPGLLPAIVLQEQDNFYLIPRRDGHILAGSTLEEIGFDRRATAQAAKLLLAKAHALLPALTEAALSGHWAGLRPGSPDNIPVIGAHPDIPNLYLNSGHYRYGITMAPASALLISNMILNKPQPLDIAPYRWPS